ncbi:hypothetical protein MRB53_042159 [Persea americana]|nr:hypothetical protein MRB53_042159 [Persea americana]
MASKLPLYKTAFQRHMSYFDRNQDGLIYPLECLRSSLALGLNFPASCALAFGLQCLYVNSNYLRLGVKVSDIKNERTQLETAKFDEASYSRAQLLQLVKDKSYVEKAHIYMLWNLAADRTGRVSAEDLKSFQDGHLLYDIEERRRNRSDVLPFSRLGPFSYVYLRQQSVVTAFLTSSQCRRSCLSCESHVWRSSLPEGQATVRRKMHLEQLGSPSDAAIDFEVENVWSNYTATPSSETAPPPVATS